MKKCLPVLVLILLGVAGLPALAHTPVTSVRLLEPGQELMPTDAVAIEDPTESMALYGLIEKPGQAAVYTFAVPGAYHLRARVQIPVLADDRFRDWHPLLILAGPDMKFPMAGLTAQAMAATGTSEVVNCDSIFHEPFGHSDYHTGKSFERDLSPGRYFLLVYSPRETGAYALVLGGREAPRSITQTLVQRARLDRLFRMGGPQPLRSPYGLSVYQYLFLLGVLFGLLAWILAGGSATTIKRVALALVDLLTVAIYVGAALFVWVSVLPGWVRWMGSLVAAGEIVSVLLKGRGLRLTVWVATAFLAVICLI